MMGADGCAALLSRSLARTDVAHPALRDMWRQDGREIYLDGVAAAVRKHGHVEVQQGHDALMKALLEVLGRLIGEDMAARVIDHGTSTDELKQGSP